METVLKCLSRYPVTSYNHTSNIVDLLRVENVNGPTNWGIYKYRLLLYNIATIVTLVDSDSDEVSVHTFQ